MDLSQTERPPEMPFITNGKETCLNLQRHFFLLTDAVANPCGEDNGGCSHLCVLSHITDNDGLGYRCKCPVGMELNEDEKGCSRKFGFCEKLQE